LASVVPLIAAVAAAGLVLLIGRADGHWQFQRFFEDMVRNVFLGSLVAGVLLWLESRERALDARREEQAARDRFNADVEHSRRMGRIAVITRTQLLSGDQPEDVSAELRTRSDRMRESAAQLSIVRDRWLQPAVADRDRQWDADAEKAAGVVWEYIEHGHRTLLRSYLERIAREVPTGASPRKDRYASANERFHDAFGELIGARIATDAAATEHLVVVPFVHANTAPRGAPEQLPEACAADHIGVCAVEPLYLLYMHLACTRGDHDPLPEAQAHGLVPGILGPLVLEMGYAADALLDLSRLVDASTEDELADMARL
jgi:hypothetical protein